MTDPSHPGVDPWTFVMQNRRWDGRPIRFWKSARRHRIGKWHALYVIATAEPEWSWPVDGRDAKWRWVGSDDRGVLLEVVALDLPDEVRVTHVMPRYREMRRANG